AVRALRRSAGFQDDENRLQVVFSSIQASSPKVLFGGKRASIRLQPGRRSFFVQLRLNLPSASHNPVGFVRYVCISRRSVVQDLAIPPDPHVVSWAFGGMVEGMSGVISGW